MSCIATIGTPPARAEACLRWEIGSSRSYATSKAPWTGNRRNPRGHERVSIFPIEVECPVDHHGPCGQPVDRCCPCLIGPQADRDVGGNGDGRKW